MLIKGVTPFNSVSSLFLNVQYNNVEFRTFNFAAEIARLVKRSTFATAKDRIFIVPFLGSRNDENSALS